MAGTHFRRLLRLSFILGFQYHGRLMSVFRRLRWALAGPLGRFLLRGLAWTCRIETSGEEAHRRLREAGKPVILLIWHGRILMAPWFFRKRGIMPLVSPSGDGEFIARITGGWGYKNLRGSSSHAIVKAWGAMLRELRAGGELIIVPDGPRGPDRILKPGCVRLARETGAALVPVTFAASRPKFLGSWDRFMLIRPFSRVRAAFGAPLFVDAATEDPDTACRRVQAACLALEKEADGLTISRL